MSRDGEVQPMSVQPRIDFGGERNSPGPPYSVELHIGELTLHGLEAVDHHRVGDVLERELARLFTERGVPSSLTRNNEAASIAAQEFRVAQGSTPEEIGAQIARAIYMEMH